MHTLDDLTYADIAPHITTNFLLHPDQPAEYVTTVSGVAPFALELTRVALLGSAPAIGRTPFELIFCAPGTAIWPQRVYRLEHPVLGHLDLFLVPVAADARGVHYQAIFS